MGAVKLLKLNRGRYAIIDAKDFQWASKFTWYLYSSRVQRNSHGPRKDRRPVLLHREILKIIDQNILVDHKDLDFTDCRRANMRRCTRAQNPLNRNKFKGKWSSKFKGTSFHSRSKYWASYISFKKHRIHLGAFETELEAAWAYDFAAYKLHGRFARLNFGM